VVTAFWSPPLAIHPPTVTETLFPFAPHCVAIPTGRDALALIQERRRICAFDSLIDNIDSDDETDGSEIAFPLGEYDTETVEMYFDDAVSWNEGRLSHSRVYSHEIDSKHEAAMVIQRAIRARWQKKMHRVFCRHDFFLSRKNTRLQYSFNHTLQEDDIQTTINMNHHAAASVLQRAWRKRQLCRERAHRRVPPMMSPRPLKRKRSFKGLKPLSDCMCHGKLKLLAHSLYDNDNDTIDVKRT
jgi:hypothetical protein